MTRSVTLVMTLFALTASAAWAAYATLPMDDLTVPEPASSSEIVIKVPAADLRRCQMTLAQVMHMPVEMDNVTVIPVDMPKAPEVRCEAE